MGLEALFGGVKVVDWGWGEGGYVMICICFLFAWLFIAEMTYVVQSIYLLTGRATNQF